MGRDEPGWVRWNSHLTEEVEQEAFGHTFKLAQDPNSQNLGTTVWDSSIVLAKFLEKNARKGEYGRRKVKGKRAIELGAGMGLGGLSFAMLGADVVLTDLKAVLPLLQRNYESNLSPAILRAMGSEWYSNVGSVKVAELDWADPSHREGLQPPYDYILAADVVYHEHIIQDLLSTALFLASNRTTVLVVNELRSESVQCRFLNIFGAHFDIKRVPASKMDPLYQHPAIQIFQMKLRRQRQAAADDAAEPAALAAAEEAHEGSDADGQCVSQPDSSDSPAAADCSPRPPDCASSSQQQTWQTRRQGAMAARALARMANSSIATESPG